MSQMIKEKEPKSCTPCSTCESDSPIATWIVLHRKTIVTVMAVIAAIAFICIWIGSNKKAAAYQTIQTANFLAQKVQQEMQKEPPLFEAGSETNSQFPEHEALIKL